MGEYDPVFGVSALRSADDFFQKSDLFFKQLRGIGPEQMIARFPDGFSAFSGVENDVKNFAVPESVITSAEVFRIGFSIISPVFVVAFDESDRLKQLVFPFGR